MIGRGLFRLTNLFQCAEENVFKVRIPHLDSSLLPHRGTKSPGFHKSQNCAPTEMPAIHRAIDLLFIGYTPNSFIRVKIYRTKAF